LRTWFAQLTQFKQLLIPFLLTLTPWQPPGSSMW
jgi:hypothetical protein